jgi:crotonobetainyl-CoA:carnitine CoA-transferase CaiB-like acyl-CoA transferase
MASALAGLRVVEIGEMITAPYAAKMLGDMGAEVIKIERPREGDRARAMGPFPTEAPDPERSALYLYANANKQGITLDISTPAGFDLLEKLVRQADVLIHNMHPPEMDRAGLSYAKLSAINPELVMTSVTPFGLTGPYRDYLAEDLITWNAGGTGYTNGTGDTDPDIPPIRPFGSPSSYAGGAHAAVATLGAVIARDLHGGGEHIDVSVQEVMVAIAGNIMTWPYTGAVQSRLIFNLIQPLEAIRAKGGWIWIQALEEHQWQSFVKIMGNPDWAGNPDFATKVLRTANWARLGPIVRDWVAQQDVLELSKRAQALRAPFVPLLTMQGMLESEHLIERGFFVAVDNPVAGRLKLPGALAKYPESPWREAAGAPTLGQHNEHVFGSLLGLSTSKLNELRAAGVI